MNLYYCAAKVLTGTDNFSTPLWAGNIEVTAHNLSAAHQAVTKALLSKVYDPNLDPTVQVDFICKDSERNMK